MDAQAIQSMKINQKEIYDWLGFTKTDLNVKVLCDCGAREQGRGVAGRGQSRPGRRLILRLESEGRAKRSLEEKHGFMWNCNVCSEILE